MRRSWIREAIEIYHLRDHKLSLHAHEVCFLFPHLWTHSIKLPDSSRESSSVPPAHMSAAQLKDANLMLNMTQFIHIPYSQNSSVDFIRIPVGKTEDLFGVQITTAAVVLLTFVWVGISIIRLSQRLFRSSISKGSRADWICSSSRRHLCLLFWHQYLSGLFGPTMGRLFQLQSHSCCNHTHGWASHCPHCTRVMQL